MHAHHDEVLALVDGRRDIELLGEPRAHPDADQGAVDPYPVPRLHAVEPEHDRCGGCRIRPTGGQHEPAPMIPGRICIRDVRRILRERHLHVGVDG